jgi:hypothetical protein
MPLWMSWSLYSITANEEQVLMQEESRECMVVERVAGTI